ALGGLLGIPCSGLYSASKFAVEGLSESLRLETRRLGIRVVLIEPGDFLSQIGERRRSTRESRRNEAYRQVFEKYKADQYNDVAGSPLPEPFAPLVATVHPNLYPHVP